MKLNSKLLLTIIGILSIIIIGGGIYIATQNKTTTHSATPFRASKSQAVTPAKGETLNFSVKSFSPRGRVSQRQNFTITFSRPIADVSLINTELDSSPVTFTPQIRGRFRWIGQDQIRFFPEVPLSPSTEYTAEILPEISPDPQHYRLTGKRDLTFFTERFYVKSARLSFEFNTPKKRRAKILGTVDFNYAVNPADLKEYLTIAYEGGTEIPCQIKTTGSNSIIRLETGEVARGDNDRRIRLQIKKDLKGVNYQLGLEKDYTSPIILKGKGNLYVHNANTRRGGSGSYIRLYLSTPVDSEAAKPYLTIEPEIDYQLTANYRYLNIHADFKPGNRYTVTVKQGLRSEDDAVFRQDILARLPSRTLSRVSALLAMGSSSREMVPSTSVWEQLTSTTSSSKSRESPRII